MRVKKQYKKGGKVKAVKKKGPKNVIDTLSDEQFLRYIKTKDVNVLPTTEISTLSRESYEKLSEPEKKVYDSFYGNQTQPYQVDVNVGGRTFNTVRKKDDIHWEDALRMVRDSGVEEITNEVNDSLDKDKFRISPENDPLRDYSFRAHASPNYFSDDFKGGSINVPKKFNPNDPITDSIVKEYYFDFAAPNLPPNMSDENKNIIYDEGIRIVKEKVARPYIKDVAAELAHLNLPRYMSEDAKWWERPTDPFRKLESETDDAREERARGEGSDPDLSNYHDPRDYEYRTHFAPDGAEAIMFLEYNLTQRLLDLLENQPQ